MKIPSSDDVVSAVTTELFGRPLVANNFRSLLVEAIVDSALGHRWKWCAADYAAWDFESIEGLRLEVKQSAALQSWEPGPSGYTSPRFDIRKRKSRWEGAQKINEIGRFAHLYIFAYHPHTDLSADHRKPTQWDFYLIPTRELPEKASIGLREVQSLSSKVRVRDLGPTVESLAAIL